MLSQPCRRRSRSVSSAASTRCRFDSSAAPDSIRGRRGDGARQPAQRRILNADVHAAPALRARRARCADARAERRDARTPGADRTLRAGMVPRGRHARRARERARHPQRRRSPAGRLRDPARPAVRRPTRRGQEARSPPSRRTWSAATSARGSMPIGQARSRLLDADLRRPGRRSVHARSSCCPKPPAASSRRPGLRGISQTRAPASAARACADSMRSRGRSRRSLAPTGALATSASSAGSTTSRGEARAGIPTARPASSRARCACSRDERDLHARGTCTGKGRPLLPSGSRRDGNR